MTFANFTEKILSLCEFEKDEILYQDITIDDFFRICEEHPGFQVPLRPQFMS